MRMAIVAVLVFMASQSSARAEWIAAGILTTHNPNMEYFKTEYVQFSGFVSREACRQVMGPVSHSDEYIGKGGTSGRVPGLHWNYDFTCLHINDE